MHFIYDLFLNGLDWVPDEFLEIHWTGFWVSFWFYRWSHFLDKFKNIGEVVCVINVDFGDQIELFCFLNHILNLAQSCRDLFNGLLKPWLLLIETEQLMDNKIELCHDFCNQSLITRLWGSVSILWIAGHFRWDRFYRGFTVASNPSDVRSSWWPCRQFDLQVHFLIFGNHIIPVELIDMKTNLSIRK